MRVLAIISTRETMAETRLNILDYVESGRVGVRAVFFSVLVYCAKV